MASIITDRIVGHGGPKQSSTNMDFGRFGDTLPKTQNLVIDNPGNQALHWTANITQNANWLTLSATSGQVAANSQNTIIATAQNNSLASGHYSATLTFALTEGNAHLNIILTAEVDV